MKKAYLFLVVFFNLSILQAQQSFQKEFASPARFSFGTLINKTGKISLLISDQPPFNGTLFFLNEYNPDLSAQSFSVIESADRIFFPLFHKVVLHNESEIIFKSHNVGAGEHITYINFETGEYWDYNIGALFLNDLTTPGVAFSIDEDGNSYLFTTGLNLGFCKISKTGEIMLKKRYSFNFPISLRELLYNPFDGTNSLLGQIHPDSLGSFVALFDTTGNFIDVKSYANVSLDQIIADPDGGYYVMGSTALINDLSQNEEDLVLMKLDAELNVTWSAAFYADNFDYKRSTLNVLPDGTLAIAYSTSGAYPVILARLDVDGNILWEKGYPLYEPEIDIMPDGSLLLTSNFSFDDSGELFLQVILSKTDTLGDIENCEVFPTCLQKTDVNILPSTLSINFLANLDIPDISLYELSFRDTIIEANTSCNIPPTPSPFFELPDTVCAGTTYKITDLPNQHAHHIEWQFSGNNADSIWQDSTSFAFTFDQTGAFSVEQTIWFLGCNYSHTEEIYVVDSMDISIQIIEGDLCGETPFTLEAATDQFIESVSWSNGFNTIFSQADESGWYFVNASNGFCQATDSILIQYIIEPNNTDSILILPEDTTICNQHLPYILIPNSAFTETYTLDGFEAPQFVLDEPGMYDVEVEIADCIYTTSFQLHVDPCSLQVFIPNIFTPNGDNINDFFYPDGNDFEVISLSIFDRWGGHIYHAKENGAQWDGKSNHGKNFPEGVYVYRILVQDSRLQTIQEYTGDVLLVR